MNSKTLAEGSLVSGKYQIEELIGRGGMGVVYKAEDTKLRRIVALKFLPEELAHDHQAVERFQREARSASALNHPHICTIYDIDEHEGQHFMAFEFLEGRTLRECLQAKRLDIEQIIDLGIQISRGLEAAHAKGIIHRDIKPGNIFVTDSGQAKILDFGLAKLLPERRPKAKEKVSAGMPTMTAEEHLTSPGSAVGTVAYMSPEQALGQELDTRTDLFSFGAVLYEMATGVLPFRGTTTAAIFNEILNAAPTAPIRINPDLPGDLERIINKALEKDRKLRYQTASDFRADLERLKRDSDSVRTAAAPMARQRPNRLLRWLVAAAGLLVILAGGFVVYKQFLSKRASSVPFQAVTSPRRLTTHGKVGDAALSPDGNYVAYSLVGPGGQSILMRQVATAVDRTIIPPAEAAYTGLTLSPDGNYLYYASWEKWRARPVLYRVSVLGGDPTKLVEDIWSPVTFSPDGKRLAFVRQGWGQEECAMIVANADGTNQKKIVSRKVSDMAFQSYPAWSPDGKAIVSGIFYPSRPGREALIVAEVQVEGGKIREINTQGWGDIEDRMAWLADGSGFLMSAADSSTGWFFQVWFVSYPDGKARKVTNDPNNYMGTSLSRDSGVLLTLQSDWLSNIWIAPDGDSSRARQITSGIYDGFGGVGWARGGKIVYGTRDWDIWVMDEDGSHQRLLTIDEHNNRDAAVSPDGRTVFFSSWRGQGGGKIWRMGIDGSEAKQLTNGFDDRRPRCSPDGKWIFYNSFTSGEYEIRKAGTDGGASSRWAGKLAGNPVVSPDGKSVVGFFYDAAADKYVLNIVPIEGGEPEKTFIRVPGDYGGSTTRWTPDGKALTYSVRQGGVSNIWLQPLTGGPARQLTHFITDDYIHDFDWTPDNRLILARGPTNQDIVLISGRQSR